jgi:hypothetical protein
MNRSLLAVVTILLSAFLLTSFGAEAPAADTAAPIVATAGVQSHSLGGLSSMLSPDEDCSTLCDAVYASCLDAGLDENTYMVEYKICMYDRCLDNR